MSKNKIERQELSAEREGVEALQCICRELRGIRELLQEFFFPAAKGFTISQQIGGSSVAITGIVKGATGTFTETPIPPNGQLQAGSVPQWSSDDTLTTLTPSADGTSVNVATSATDPATSFNLTVTGVASDGTKISGTANVPLTTAVVPASGFTINQTA